MHVVKCGTLPKLLGFLQYKEEDEEEDEEEEEEEEEEEDCLFLVTVMMHLISAVRCRVRKTPKWVHCNV